MAHRYPLAGVPAFGDRDDIIVLRIRQDAKQLIHISNIVIVEGKNEQPKSIFGQAAISDLPDMVMRELFPKGASVTDLATPVWIISRVEEAGWYVEFHTDEQEWRHQIKLVDHFVVMDP